MSGPLRTPEGFIAKKESTPLASEMVINPKGARIENLTLGNRFILRPVLRGDGKIASTHPCTPIFGPDKNNLYGLPQHGPMRDAMTQVIEEEENRVVLEYDIESGSYPSGMKVQQVFSLLNGVFTLETTHANNGEQEAPVNFGEHFYWAAPQGWEGLKINGKDMTDAVKDDQTVPLNSRNIIVIPGVPEIILEQQGMPIANLWVYRNKEGKYDVDYVCIEPVEGDPNGNFFGSDQSLIQPGNSRKTVIKISQKA